MLRPLSSYDNINHTAVSQPIVASSSKPSFEIFQDATTTSLPHLGNTCNTGSWALGTQKERSKENNNISSWLKFTLPQKKVDVKKPSFEVYVENESNSKLSEKKQAEVFKLVTPKAEYVFPAAEPGCTRMYHASMLVCNNEELSFEEIRANINAQRKQTKAFESSTPTKDVEMGDYTIVVLKELKKKVDPKYSFGGSPTIHTKAALQDVLNIFEDSTLNFSKISHLSPSNSMSAFTLHHKLAAMKDDTQTNVSSFLVFEDNIPAKPSAKFEVYDENAENRGLIAPPRIEKAPINSILTAKEEELLAPLTFKDTISPVETENIVPKSIIPNYQTESKYSFEIYEDEKAPVSTPKEKLNIPASKLSNILNVEETLKSKSTDHSNGILIKFY